MCLVDIIKTRVTTILNAKEGIPSEAFRRDFATIQINLGRRAGHTTLAKQLADSGVASIVTVHAASQFKGYRCFDLESPETWCGRYSAVFVVDPATLIKNSYKKKYKHFLNTYPNAIIIELG